MEIFRDILIITNNPLINEKFNKSNPVILLNGGYIDVLYNARDKIHKGSKLLTHPLMGSLKPNETPFRTIILDNVIGNLDMDSLFLIENSIATSKKFPIGEEVLKEEVLQDFRILDLKLIESAISTLSIF